MAAVDGVDMQLGRICTWRVGVLYQKTVGGRDSHAVRENMQLQSMQLDSINCIVLLFDFSV